MCRFGMFRPSLSPRCRAYGGGLFLFPAGLFCPVRICPFCLISQARSNRPLIFSCNPALACASLGSSGLGFLASPGPARLADVSGRPSFGRSCFYSRGRVPDLRAASVRRGAPISSSAGRQSRGISPPVGGRRSRGKLDKKPALGVLYPSLRILPKPLFLSFSLLPSNSPKIPPN